jgi:5'-methylthioadenosine nucleosidase
MHTRVLMCTSHAIQVVTDIVDGDRPTAEEFLENLGAAARSLQEAVPKTIDFVAGKRLSEL